MLDIKKVSVSFSSGSGVPAVDDMSLTLTDSNRIAIVGETGSGKSVLLLAVLGLLPPSATVDGEILLDGEDLLKATPKRMCSVRGAIISYVPQGGGGSMNPLLKVGFQVGEPLMEHRGYSKRRAILASIPLMKRFNLLNAEKTAYAYPHTFSGGMRQRAMISMGISAGARIILADEPTKGLDARRVDLVIDAFNQLEGETLLCVTHDLLFAKAISDQISVMYASQQVEFGDTKDILHEPLHPYTQDMIRAIPEYGMVYNRGFATLPDDGMYQNGCKYALSCAHCTSRCAQRPPMVEQNGRKVRCWLYAD